MFILIFQNKNGQKHYIFQCLRPSLFLIVLQNYGVIFTSKIAKEQAQPALLLKFK